LIAQQKGKKEKDEKKERKKRKNSHRSVAQTKKMNQIMMMSILLCLLCWCSFLRDFVAFSFRFFLAVRKLFGLDARWLIAALQSSASSGAAVH